MTDVREALASICESICSRGLTGPLASGNASVFDAAVGVLAITPSGVPFAEVGPEDVVFVDLEGGYGNGRPRRRPSSELPLHLAVHRHCPSRYRAILHLHSPYAVAAACLDLDRLPVVHYYQALLGVEPTPILPYAPPGSEELAEQVGAAFSSGRLAAVLLAHHGAVVAGPTERLAVDLAELLEDVCRLAVVVGARAATLPEHELDPLAAALGDYVRRSG